MEILFPVDQPELKEKLLHILQSQLRDNVKASVLRGNGTYEKVSKRGQQAWCSQKEFCVEAAAEAKKAFEEDGLITRTFIPEIHHES